MLQMERYVNTSLQHCSSGLKIAAKECLINRQFLSKKHLSTRMIFLKERSHVLPLAITLHIFYRIFFPMLAISASRQTYSMAVRNSNSNWYPNREMNQYFASQQKEVPM